MKNANEKMDYNIAFLRPILCLGVICNHFNSPLQQFPLFLSSCVPIFFLISFYLLNENYGNATGGGIKTLQKRIVRLTIPILAWAIIYFIAINFLSLCAWGGLRLTFKDFLLQILGGHRFNPSLWFLYDLLIITVVYSFLREILKTPRSVQIVFGVFTIVSFILEYSGLNYNIFSPLDYSLRFTVGRICEMVPYAFAGLLLHYLLNTRKYILLIISFLLLAVGAIEYLWGTHPPGFGYQGLYLLFFSISFFILFHLVDFNRLSSRLLVWINYLSQYTLGIYCMHLLTGQIIYTFLSFFKLSTNISSYICFFIYGVSFIFFDVIDHFIHNKYLRMIYK